VPKIVQQPELKL